MTLLAALLLAPGYIAGEQKWRADLDRSMRAPESWLSVAGLHWIGDAPVTLGSAPSSDVVLPGTASIVGTATLLSGKVYFSPEPAGGATVDGRPVGGMVEIRSDAESHPGELRVGNDVVTVIRRGSRIGLRIYDPSNPRRKAFRGLRWYPIDPAYRIVARFVPYPKPKTLMITNVLGDVSPVSCPGYAEFRIGGQVCRLDAEPEGPTYFFNFGDRTNNRTTYGAGRFLNAAPPSKGQIVLDFNRAVNPPCAFTDFATCPLPPKQNVLPVAIPAGALNGHPESNRPGTRR